MWLCVPLKYPRSQIFLIYSSNFAPPLAAPRGGQHFFCASRIFCPLDLFLYTPLNYFLMILHLTVSLKATNKWVIHVNCSFYCRFLLQKQKRKLVKPFWKEGRQRHVPSFFLDKNYKKNRYEWLSLLSLGYL